MIIMMAKSRGQKCEKFLELLKKKKNLITNKKKFIFIYMILHLFVIPIELDQQASQTIENCN